MIFIKQSINPLNTIINKEFIIETKYTEWDFGNEILYHMCTENFEHNENDKIIGKVILIGRAYAAAIERRKNKTEENNSFYLDKVAPKIKNSDLDIHLSKLKSYSELEEENIPEILRVHFYLINLIKDLTNQNKRSFSSKYLHFHFPHLFFLYDSRAVKAISFLEIKKQYKYKELSNYEEIDKNYASFYYKCFTLKNALEKEYGQKITPRHLDNILMKIIEKGTTKTNTQI